MKNAPKALTLATAASVFLVLLLCSVREAVSESDLAAPSSGPHNVENGAGLSGEGLFSGEEETENQQSKVVQKRRSRSPTSSILGDLSPNRLFGSSSLASKVLVAVTMVASAMFLLYRVGDVVLKCLEEADSQTLAGSTPRSLAAEEGQGLSQCIQRGMENVETGRGAAGGSVYNARKDKRQKLATAAAFFVLAIAVTIGVIFFNMTGGNGTHVGYTGGVAAVAVLSVFSVAIQAGYSFWRLNYNTESSTAKSVGRGMFLHYIVLAVVVLLAIILPLIQNLQGGVHWFSLAVPAVLSLYLMSPYFLGGKGKRRDTGI